MADRFITGEPPTDTELVDAAVAGDRVALEQLLRRHQQRIHAVCRRIVGNDADAADASQNALVLVVRNLHRFDGRSAFSTWVYRIATNAALDELRRRGRRAVPTAFDVSERETPRDGALDGDFTEGVVDRDELEAALAALPEEFRVAVVLRDVADLDYAEIAEVLDIPPGTVRSRIARGRAGLLRAVTEPTGNQPGSAGRPTRVRASDEEDDR
jgi:RNA polymerase sigma-70 factor, ECF subfamily